MRRGANPRHSLHRQRSVGKYVLFGSIVVFLSYLAWGLSSTASPAPAASASVRRQQAASAAPTQTSPTPVSKPPSERPPTYSWTEIDARVKDDVGLVIGCDKSFLGLACSGQLAGTAWVVNAGPGQNTFLVTANHVVTQDKAGTITVHLPGVGVEPATVIAQDATDDVAMLEIRGLPQSGGLDPAGAFPSCGSDTATVGQQVAEIGYPRGDYQQALTTGAVTGVDVRQFVLSLGIMTEDAYNAANIPGESGAPVFNQQGCVIGIADAVTATDANNGDFLPISDIHTIGVNW